MLRALIVIVLSTAMMSGGRKVMRHENHSRIDGALSFMIGLGLLVSWYANYPDDFSDLADAVLSSAHRVLGSGMSAGFVLAMLLPVGIGFGLLVLVYKFEGRDRLSAVKNIVGPVPRIRRPKILR